MLQNQLTYRRKMSIISTEIHIVQFRAVCSLLILWRFLLSKIFVYEFSQQNSLFNLKNRFKGHFSITQIPGNKSVYLGEKPNTIILPLVKRLAFFKCYPNEVFFFNQTLQISTSSYAQRTKQIIQITQKLFIILIFNSIRKTIPE